MPSTERTADLSIVLACSEKPRLRGTVYTQHPVSGCAGHRRTNALICTIKQAALVPCDAMMACPVTGQPVYAVSVQDSTAAAARVPREVHPWYTQCSAAIQCGHNNCEFVPPESTGNEPAPLPELSTTGWQGTGELTRPGPHGCLPGSARNALSGLPQAGNMLHVRKRSWCIPSHAMCTRLCTRFAVAFHTMLPSP